MRPVARRIRERRSRVKSPVLVIPREMTEQELNSLLLAFRRHVGRANVVTVGR